MLFEEFVTGKLNFINDELAMVQAQLDLLGVELNLVKVNLAILETQMSGILWMNRIIIGGVAILVIGQLWKMMINFGLMVIVR